MASILAMVGCANDADFNKPALNKVEMSVVATNETSDDTRVSFKETIYDMVWNSDDQIGVYVASTNEKSTFTLSEMGEDKKSASFRAMITEPAAIDNYFAFYPATTTVSGTEAIFNLPAEVAGMSEPMLVASHKEVAMDQVALNFKPVTAVLELTLGFAADKVVLEGNNGEALSGACTFNLTDGSVSYPTGAASLTLTAPMQGANYLYLPAVELSKGYKITVWVGEQQMVQSVAFATGKSFKAGEVSTLAINEFKPVTISLCDVVTSYTLYTRGDSAANSTDAHTIAFNGNCSFSGISTTLVEECGVYYGSTKIVGTRSGKNFTVAAATGVAKGAHSVCAYVKAGGVEYKSAATTAYITGLPYSAPFNSAETATSAIFSADGWSGNDRCTVDNDSAYGYCIELQGGEKSGDTKRGYVISPEFPAPANVNITVAFDMGSTGGRASEIGVAAKNVNISNWSYASTISGNVNWTANSANLTITPSNPCVLIRTTQYKVFIYGYSRFRNFNFTYAF